MTDPMTSPPECSKVRELLPELALGVLVGSDRAGVIRHLESCGACADELEELTGAADHLLSLLPAADPPAGFESRLLDRRAAQANARHGGGSEREGRTNVWHGRGEERTGARRPRRPVRRTLVGVAAGALLLGGGIGVGAAIVPTGQAAAFRSVELTHNGVPDGRLMVALSRPGWLFMDLRGVKSAGWVRCVVTERGGREVTVGSYALTNGYGAWTARLHIPGSDLVAARIETDAGVTLASARLDQ
jgi:hypothetical protein